MKITTVLPLLAGVALAACSGGGEDAAGEGMSAEEAVASVSESEVVRPEPGQYRTKVELVDFTIPGQSEAEMAQMRGFMEGAMAAGSEFCLTPEEAERGWEQMVDEMAKADCTFQTFDVGGGTLDVAATCTSEDGTVGTMKMAGTTGATSSSMTMEMDQAAPGMAAGSTVHMKMKMDSQRIGDCA
mgnify:CR=1 FL=1